MATEVKRPTGREEILDAVLDAAERLFAAAGPADVSLRAIAQEAGVNYGLVHRHFGTKDVLFERLMQRYTDRWLARLADEPDYDAALDQLLGADLTGSPYLRLLAWTLLSDRQPSGTDAHSRHAALDRLPPLLEQRGDRTGPEATVDTAAALAFAFGWRFFNPFIRAALHLDETGAISDDELHAAMQAHMRTITAPQ